MSISEIIDVWTLTFDPIDRCYHCIGYHRYVTKVFCPRVNISPDQLQEKLRIFEASMASIQVMCCGHDDDG
jgi:hypothetical protein